MLHYKLTSSIYQLTTHVTSVHRKDIGTVERQKTRAKDGEQEDNSLNLTSKFKAADVCNGME